MKLALSLLALVYVLLPYDFFPDLVIGWGWIDDLVILYLLWRFFYRGKGRSFFQSQGASGRAQDSADKKASFTGHGNQPNDPYDVLQIPRGASQEEIKTAYKHLAGKYHPDKVLHLGEEFQALAEERFKEIQSAYQKLAVRDRKDKP